MARNDTSEWTAERGLSSMTDGSHGFYAVIVDNGPIIYMSGMSVGRPLFQVPLYESTGLDEGPHQILIVNENKYNSTDPAAICRYRPISARVEVLIIRA